MRRSILITIDCEETACGTCRHANNPESYRYCAVFDERIRQHPNAVPVRCDGCVEGEINIPGMDEAIKQAAHEIVREVWDMASSEAEVTE